MFKERFLFRHFLLLWESFWGWLVKKVRHTDGCKPWGSEHDSVYTRPRSPWLIPGSCFPPQTGGLLPVAENHKDECYPGPATLTRNHLWLGHEPGCVQSLHRNVSQGGWDRELTNQNAVAVGCCSMDLECFQAWIFWNRWRGRKERVRRTTYPPHWLLLHPWPAPSVPSTCLGSLL